MDASNLTPEQAQRIASAVTQMVGYTHRLAHGMQRMGWRADDPMYRAAWDAYHALHALCVHARHASCLPGTAGKPSEQSDSEPPRWLQARGVSPPPPEPSAR